MMENGLQEMMEQKQKEARQELNIFYIQNREEKEKKASIKGRLGIKRKREKRGLVKEEINREEGRKEGMKKKKKNRERTW